MIMSIRTFREIMLSEANAPLVAYLSGKGLTPKEIIQELNAQMKHYAIDVFKYQSKGNVTKTSDSKKLLSVTEKTKQYITKYGEQAILELSEVADSQLEKWCLEMEDINIDIHEEHPNKPEY